MLKGEVYERYTDTFLHGLKHEFLEASLKPVSNIPPHPTMSLPLTHDNEITVLSALEPPYHRRHEHMRLLQRALYRPWHRTGPVL